MKHFFLGVITGIVVIAIGYITFVHTAQSPTHPDDIFSEKSASSTDTTHPEISISTPTRGERVVSPLQIKGSARGWYFEGSFPVQLVDQNRAPVATGVATAQSDWMTSEAVLFIAELNWEHKPETKTGILILRKDNPSGIPELDRSFELPIRFE
jgi:hypothetical protein